MATGRSPEALLARATVVRELELVREERDRLLGELQANREKLLAIVPRARAAPVAMSVRAIAAAAGVKRERLTEWMRGDNASVRRGRRPA